MHKMNDILWVWLFRSALDICGLLVDHCCPIEYGCLVHNLGCSASASTFCMALSSQYTTGSKGTIMWLWSHVFKRSSRPLELCCLNIDRKDPTSSARMWVYKSECTSVETPILQVIQVLVLEVLPNRHGGPFPSSGFSDADARQLIYYVKLPLLPNPKRHGLPPDQLIP